MMGFGLMAQDAQLILVEGRVLSSSDSMPIPFAHVWGNQRNVGAITDSNGYFQIYAYQNDSLSFSIVGYGIQAQPVPPEAQTKHVDFWLYVNAYEIDEVTVLPYTREQFPRMFMNLQLPPDKYAINLNLPEPPPSVGPKHTLKPGMRIALGILTGNLYAIVPEKVIFKERWEQGQVDKWLSNEQYLERIAQKYNPTYVKLVVPVAEDEVAAFIKFCDLKNDFIDAATEYEIGEAIKECYTAWVSSKPLPQEGQ